LFVCLFREKSQPTTSGVTTIRPSPVRKVPAENESLEAMDFINVTLNYEAESDASPSAASRPFINQI